MEKPERVLQVGAKNKIKICSEKNFPSFWRQKDQEYMIIIFLHILLHILASDVGPRKKFYFYSTLGKILFLFHFGKNLGRKFRELAKNKILIFFLFGHLEGRLIRAPTNKKILALPWVFFSNPLLCISLGKAINVSILLNVCALISVI
jgi:hypothetical protein